MTTNVQPQLTSERERNRKAMPTVTAFVDQMRKIFGDGVTVTYAAENGITKGEQGPEGVVPVLQTRKKRNTLPDEVTDT